MVWLVTTVIIKLQRKWRRLITGRSMAETNWPRTCNACTSRKDLRIARFIRMGPQAWRMLDTSMRLERAIIFIKIAGRIVKAAKNSRLRARSLQLPLVMKTSPRSTSMRIRPASSVMTRNPTRLKADWTRCSRLIRAFIEIKALRQRDFTTGQVTRIDTRQQRTRREATKQATPTSQTCTKSLNF